MKDRKTGRKAKDGLRVVHRNDRSAVRRWGQGSGQALLPMLELLENAQASIDELMNEAARTVVEALAGSLDGLDLRQSGVLRATAGVRRAGR